MSTHDDDEFDDDIFGDTTGAGFNLPDDGLPTKGSKKHSDDELPLDDEEIDDEFDDGLLPPEDLEDDFDFSSEE